MFSDLLSRYSTTIDPRTLLVNLLIAVILGYGVSLLYLFTVGRDDKKLARLLPVMAAATTLACTLIASSLGIAIGLVGAMSIVRFRNVAPRLDQSAFLFLAIAVGLAGGTGHALTALVALVVIAPVLVLRFRNDQHKVTLVELAIRGERQQVESVLPGLSGQIPGLRLASMKQVDSEAQYRFTFPSREWDQVLSLQQQLSGTPHIHISFSERDEAEAE